jgi:multiple sugar transport system substrate-binding protein
MYKRKQFAWIGVLLLLAMLLVACQPQATPAPATEEAAAEEPAPAEKPELSITWFAWPPCDAIAQLVAEYPDAEIKVNCVPYPEWHDSIFTDFAAKGGVDLPIVDSQDTGAAVVGGHIIELTDFLKNRTDFDQWVPSALSAYGEYPPDSGRYYGSPIMADVQVLIYNKEILGQYGFDEPADTWEGLLEQAQTIKEGGEHDGFVWFWIGSGDQIQSAWNELAWSWGGALWDPATYTFEGVVNSPENVAALEFARELYLTGPEGAGNFSYGEVTTAMCDGTAAMTAIWVGVAAGWTDVEACPQFPNMAFAVPPAGPKAHILQLGGMGMNVSAYTPDKDVALNFLEWLMSEETQLKWVQMGGYSALQSVLDSDTFKSAAPFNPVFSEAYPLVKDFYNLPEYQPLMTKEGEYLNLAVTGQMSAQEALDALAADQQAIIEEAYPDGPPQ